jgi:hypothetical protein
LPRGIKSFYKLGCAASREESDPTRLNRLGQMRRGDVITPRHAEGAQSFARF